MKKLLISAVIAMTALTASAGPLDVFNHLGVGAGVGTGGVTFEVATPITSFVQMRAGVTWMPAFTFNANVQYTYYNPGVSDPQYGETKLKGDLDRLQGQVIFNVYPVPKVPFYVAAGAYFGGNKLVKISGNIPELGTYSAEQRSAIIGDYKIPCDPDGNVSGGLEVKNFRPYLGLGWGRVIPGKLLNFSTELGVQFEGKPKLYTDYGEIDESVVEDNNAFNKISKALRVYPTLTFRLNFRLF